MSLDLITSADGTAQEKDKIQAKLESSAKVLSALLSGVPAVAHIDLGIDNHGLFITREVKVMGQEVYKAEVGSGRRRPVSRYGHNLGRGIANWAARG